MAGPQGKCSSPSCAFSHHIINQLTAIIGNCDILRELAEHLEAPNPHCMKRLDAIRNLAMKLAAEMNSHVCALDAETQQASFPEGSRTPSPKAFES